MENVTISHSEYAELQQCKQDVLKASATVKKLVEKIGIMPKPGEEFTVKLLAKKAFTILPQLIAGKIKFDDINTTELLTIIKKYNPQ